MKTIVLRGLAVCLAAFCLIAPVAAAPNFPALTGRVVDDANILTPQTKSDLNDKLAALEAKTSRQLVVVTLPSLQGYDIADYGYQLGRAWGIGQKKLDNGALLIVAPNEHRVRIEVGYGLEPVLTDALSSVIEQSAILPKFRSGDYNGGVSDGVDAIIAQLSLDPSAAEQKVAAAQAQLQQSNNSGSGSGGFPVVFIILIAVFIILRLLGRGTGIGFWPLLFLGGGRGFGGGGFGGGGFSGGGGGFGGGGASGSW